MKTRPVKVKKSSQVRGQYYGYSLQTTRFLVRLLEGDPNWNVSLEAFEDVGVETPNGFRIAEQDKSAPHSNPVSNHAVDLWKTFSNWVRAVQSGQLDPERTIFEIYISHPRKGEIVERFSEASTLNDSLDSLTKAKTTLWGPQPRFPHKDRLPNTIKSYVLDVLQADERLVSKIIKNFSLKCGSGRPQTDLRILLDKALVSEEILEDVIKYALGWVKREIDILLEESKIASIKVDTFRRNLKSFVRRIDRRTILATFAESPSLKEIESQRLRTYVRQLEIIEEDDDHKIHAIIDFIKAEADRTQWSAKGWVDESSFDDFEEGLIRTWKNLKKKTNISLSNNSEVERGQYLCSECEMHQTTLEGLNVPSHFTPGSFHTLSDNSVIGWHPNFELLLKDDMDEKV